MRRDGLPTDYFERGRARDRVEAPPEAAAETATPLAALLARPANIGTTPEPLPEPMAPKLRLLLCGLCRKYPCDVGCSCWVDDEGNRVNV